MEDETFFIPAIGSERGLGEVFPIDAHAPRGIFETTEGNIYLVCDYPSSRFAIILKHHLFRQFEAIELKAIAFDYGTWLGVGKFCFVKKIPDDMGSQNGQIWVEEDIIQMWVGWHDGRMRRPTIAFGSWYCICGGFNVWALIVDDRIVFQYDGSESHFDEQLTSKVKALM